MVVMSCLKQNFVFEFFQNIYLRILDQTKYSHLLNVLFSPSEQQTQPHILSLNVHFLLKE
uniref:Uncharacterized protein n=1 Tax=Anguilla anguilla TaxID=7936 RepID=A0A0E9TC44_ANGAN